MEVWRGLRACYGLHVQSTDQAIPNAVNECTLLDNRSKNFSWNLRNADKVEVAGQSLRANPNMFGRYRSQ